MNILKSMIKSAKLFHVIEKEVDIDIEKINESLAKNKFVPCEGLDWSRTGFAEFDASLAGEDRYVIDFNNVLFLKVRTQDKILPSSVVATMLEDKVLEIQENEDRKVGKKEKAALKQQIEDDLLPKAFVKDSYVNIFIDRENKLLVLDNTSDNKVDSVISLLLTSLLEFGFTKINYVKSFSDMFKDEIISEKHVEQKDNEFGSAISLSGDNEKLIRYKNIDLWEDKVFNTITENNIKDIEIVINEEIRFVFDTDKNTIKGIKLLNIKQDFQDLIDSSEDLFAMYSSMIIIQKDCIKQIYDKLDRVAEVKKEDEDVQE